MAYLFALWLAVLPLLSLAEDNVCPGKHNALIVALQGKLLYAPDQTQTANWQEAHLNDLICENSRVRLDNYSRATLKLSSAIYINLHPGTVIALKDIGADQPTWLTKFQGFIHVISRTPKRLTIETPIANAGPEGTEFAMSANDSQVSVWVFEGDVKLYNKLGAIKLKPNEAGQAQLNQAPQAKIDIKPQDAVNWALYYPPILPYPTGAQRDDTRLVAAVNAFRQGKTAEALNQLETAPRLTNTELQARAAMRLTLGQAALAEQDIQTLLKQNPKNAEALALQSIKALAQNQKDDALALANQAIAANPHSAPAYSALSYAEQSQFQLKKALTAADTAVNLAPLDALAWARKAELQQALGLTSDSQEAAQQAAKLDPDLGRTQTVLGFAYLGRMDTDAALTAFNKAVGFDSSSPLAHLGLGLTKIRQGDLTDGKQDLEVAAMLDPNNSLVRSYLGKAYYEERRSGKAEDQYNLAKQFDPKDPTPYFYDAINKQTTNRPVEALQDMQKAIELNNNRAVYRSKLALDDDLAARGAAIGRIYNELGFYQRGLVEGWQSLVKDPTNYTSHRLLSDSYSILPRHDFASSSELLQSQLLQPINITPVQPRLAESSLFLLGGVGPSATSMNEFNPLFERNRFSLLASGLLGSHDTYSDEVVQSGLWDNFSYSLGQFHYQTNGYRLNNDVDTNIYNAFVQGQVSTSLNLQAEYRYREINRGDLESFFDTPINMPQNDFVNTYRRHEESNLYRFGMHWKPSSQSELLGSFIHIDQSTITNADSPIDYHANIGETQYIYNFDIVKSLVGGGYYSLDTYETFVKNTNGYLYNYINFPSTVNWTLGFSFNILNDKQFPNDLRAINPKLGVLWELTPKTLIRAAVFRNERGDARLPYQTIEPVQIAGFNQFFDDTYRTEALRWGIGLDQKFGTTFSGGAEFSKRYLHIHTLGENIDNEGNFTGYLDSKTKQQEATVRAYLLWTPHPFWSGSLEYFYENFDNFADGSPRDTETHIIPATLSFFHPTGFFAKLKNSVYHQKVNIDGDNQDDTAVFLDLSIGYRFPKRHGIFEIQFQNLLNQNYRYEGLQARQAVDTSGGGIPFFMPYSPDFSVFSRVTFAF